MKKIFITGASGFVGQKLVSAINTKKKLVLSFRYSVDGVGS